MRISWLRSFAIIAAVGLSSGCSGGAHGVVPSAPGKPSVPSGPTATETVKIGIPVASSASAERKHPQFVVSATNGLEIKAVNGSAVQVGDQVYDVSSASPDCAPASGGLRTCTLSFVIPIGGPYTATVISYDQAPSGGVIPGGANELARGVASITVVQGAANAFGATLDGTASTLQFTTPNSVSLIGDTSYSNAVPLDIADASGTYIVGALSAPLTVAVTDSGAHTLLSIDGGTTKSSTVQLTSSTDAANLVAYYDGAASAGYSASIAASGASTGSTTLLSTFAVTGTVGFGTPHFSGGNADFTAPSQQLVLTPNEPNFAGTFSQTNTCAGFVTVAPVAATFTAQSVAATASCTVNVSDGALSIPVPVTVTTTSGSIGVPPPRGTVNIVASGFAPNELVLGPDDAMWITGADAGGDSEFARVDESGTLTEYPITGDTAAYGIAVGPDGRIWTADFNDGMVYAIDVTTHVISSYDLTADIASGVTSLVAGPDGNLWLADGGGYIDRIATDGTFLSQTYIPYASTPAALIVGPDGAMWFGDELSGQIGRMDPVTLAMTRYPTDGIPFAGVSRMAVGHDGAIWFPASWDGGIGRMTTSGAFTLYVPTTTSAGFGIVSAPDNTLWFTGCGCGSGLSTMTTGGTEIPLNGGTSVPHDLAIGPDGAIWFTDLTNSDVGRIQP